MLAETAAERAVEEVEKYRRGLSQLLLIKSLEVGGSRGQLLYLLSRVISGFTVVHSGETTIMGVSGDVLVVGPLYEKFIESVRRKRPGDVGKVISFLLLHEALHRLLGHDVRIKLAGDRELYNIVSDLYVNTVIERVFNLKFEGVVTLDTLADFVVHHFRASLTPEQIRAVRELGVYEVENRISVEQAYNVLSMLPREVVESIKKKFGSGNFYGKDILAGGGHGGSLEKALDDAADSLEEIVERINTAIGEYQAFGKNPGTERGIREMEEYRQISRLVARVHRLFLRDVGETLTDYTVTFERFSEEAYWLPDRVRERRRVVVGLVDSSPSVPTSHLRLFLSCVENAVRVFDVEYWLIIFGTGVLDNKVVTVDNIPDAVTVVPRGRGTVWDETVADKIREGALRGARLLQVLSDFMIVVEEDAKRALSEFKKMGGHVSCFSSSGEFLDFCDSRYPLPVIPE